MCFWKSYICSNKLDVQETNFSFAQFNRIINHFFGCRFEIRRDSRSRFMKEIVSGGGGDTYTFSYMISSDFITTTFEIQ